MEQVGCSGCAVSVLGAFQAPAGKSPEHPGLTPRPTLLWAFLKPLSSHGVTVTSVILSVHVHKLLGELHLLTSRQKEVVGKPLQGSEGGLGAESNNMHRNLTALKPPLAFFL